MIPLQAGCGSAIVDPFGHCEGIAKRKGRADLDAMLRPRVRQQVATRRISVRAMLEEIDDAPGPVTGTARRCGGAHKDDMWGSNNEVDD